MIWRSCRATRATEAGAYAIAPVFALPSGFNTVDPHGLATAEDLLAAGEIGPCEFGWAALVMMSAAEFGLGLITHRIAAFLHAHVAARQLGFVTATETGFLLARAADVAFVARARLPRGVGHPLRLRVESLRHLVEHVRRLVNPAPLLLGRRVDLPKRSPDVNEHLRRYGGRMAPTSLSKAL